MGGAVAVKTATKLRSDPQNELGKRVSGVFLIDVAEGSAIDALPYMENIVL